MIVHFGMWHESVFNVLCAERRPNDWFVRANTVLVLNPDPPLGECRTLSSHQFKTLAVRKTKGASNGQFIDKWRSHRFWRVVRFDVGFDTGMVHVEVVPFNVGPFPGDLEREAVPAWRAWWTK